MMLGRQLPKVEATLLEARNDLLAFTGYAQVHWRRIWSAIPLERVDEDTKRPTDVVALFPNTEALKYLAGAVPVEQNDEWGADRRYFSEQSMAPITSMTA